MPVGSRYEMSWGDFKSYLHDFEDFVMDNVFQKMGYGVWRRFRTERPLNTRVYIEKSGDGFNIMIGDEPEYHHFVRGDDSFGDFFCENFLDREEAYDYWMMPQCTSSNIYSARNYKIDFAQSESVKNTALKCGEQLKASADAAFARIKDTLASAPIGICAQPADATVSFSFDTKVDKAEFDEKLNALADKIQAVADQYNNIDKKENVNMKGFNFDFGPMNGNVVRMSIYGLAVKNKTGSWVAYDAKNEEIMDVDVFNFDGAKFLYRMPVAINDVAAGDVIVHMSVPMFVVGKSDDGKAVYAVDPVAGERKEIMLTKSPFGFNFVTKVVNFLGNAFSSADASNPFGNLGLMLMLSEDGNGVKDMLPLMMMANGGNMDMSNPLMMYALMSGDGKMGDMLPLMLMMNANKPAVHVCNCGQHNQ